MTSPEAVNPDAPAPSPLVLRGGHGDGLEIAEPLGFQILAPFIDDEYSREHAAWSEVWGLAHAMTNLEHIVLSSVSGIPDPPPIPHDVYGRDGLYRETVRT